MNSLITLLMTAALLSASVTCQFYDYNPQYSPLLAEQMYERAYQQNAAAYDFARHHGGQDHAGGTNGGHHKKYQGKPQGSRGWGKKSESTNVWLIYSSLTLDYRINDWQNMIKNYNTLDLRKQHTFASNNANLVSVTFSTKLVGNACNKVTSLAFLPRAEVRLPRFQVAHWVGFRTTTPGLDSEVAGGQKTASSRSRFWLDFGST